MIDLDQFMGLILWKHTLATHYVPYNQAYFAGLIFVVRQSSTKKRENWTSQKYALSPDLHIHNLYIPYHVYLITHKCSPAPRVFAVPEHVPFPI